MNQKKYQKYLKKYLKAASTDSKEILSSFVREYGHLKKQGLLINGLGSLGDETVISVSYPKEFDKSKIPKVYKGLVIR